ncbi:peptidylprolyl isomerase [Candidatus Woesearchaeota archaeon]|nr:peptidylprolyl isomerase [Candidatus Woesearchaeota archaeon]MCF7900952.1 peptidylprolyl isomerase [Candidatus Woesearchaeota archaeon]MCF8013602.1 peptidylprolyl isomerase [Candidatus Woesearchaeota archaeon]
MTVKKGDKVKVEYTGKFEDGTVFDSSEKHGQPMEFEVGAGKVIKGFDEALIGMNVNDSKNITIKPAEGYGDHKPELIQPVPRDQLPKEQEPKKGMILMMKMQNGQQFPAQIVEVTDTEVKIDLNHPLAGKTLIFNLKVVEIN